MLRTLWFLLEGEVQGGGVDAVPKTGGRRSVFEDMSEMGVTAATHDLGSHHEVAAIRVLFDVLRRHRRPEARPARAGVKFGIGAKKLISAADAFVNTFVLEVVVLPGEGPLSSLSAGDSVLLGR
jgi:hypothetical protein